MRPGRLDEVLGRFGTLSICVVGDLFLDRYIDLDGTLHDVSLETGLETRQAVTLRHYPGAGGTVANNLAALGVGRVAVLSCIGVDGEGFELKRAMDRAGIDRSLLIEREDRFTPTYTKPMLSDGKKAPRELHRIDIKNRKRLPRTVEEAVLKRLSRCVREMDGVLISDQVQDAGCGVITSRVRKRLAELGERYPDKILFADSRCRIDRFRRVIVKPNRHEAVAALGRRSGRLSLKRIREGALAMSRRTRRPVYVTLGEAGCLCVRDGRVTHVPTFCPESEIDIVGAGDSFAAGAAAALCAGANYEEAGLTGNLVASITVQKIGVTGTATQAEVRRRLREFESDASARG